MVTYSPEQKKFAQETGQRLATIAVPGVEFQGPVTADEAKEMEAWALGFITRRSARIKAERDAGK